MTLLDILFIVANAMLFIGTCLLIKVVWKDRAMLKGYSPVGALLTLIPLIIFIVCYVIMANWIAIALASVTVLYWGMVSFYTIFKGGPR